MSTAVTLGADVGIKSACNALNISRATLYRDMEKAVAGEQAPTKRPAPPLALSEPEKQSVLDVLHSERFCDKAPRQVYAAMIDEGSYLCSVVRTMYRLLTAEHGDVKERRRHVKRPAYVKPELLATGPNQVWSWDITKLKGPVKWNYFHLYVILDIYSRYVVGWMIAHREQDALAKQLIKESCVKQNISPYQLTIHADRGSSMKSKTVAHLLADLGVTKTHSRPHVSNDNPYSEAQFKTLKYCPEFPYRFGSIQDARAFGRNFFIWYNKEHYHTGIALMTPEQVHYGMADYIYQQRSVVLEAAFRRNPSRFKNVMPSPLILPKAVWINPPSTQKLEPKF
jgi:putative transposase